MSAGLGAGAGPGSWPVDAFKFLGPIRACRGGGAATLGKPVERHAGAEILDASRAPPVVTGRW